MKVEVNRQVDESRLNSQELKDLENFDLRVGSEELYGLV
jgi:hypothetical protein